jgi:hypothetical protein
MTYSSYDFTGDVLRCLADTGALATEPTADDLGEQADAAIVAIIGLNTQARGARFIAEVLAHVASLGALKETFGERAIEYTLYLSNAIATGGSLILPARRGDYADFVASLPTGREWTLHVRIASG